MLNRITPEYKITLASKSPRRRRLLGLGGWEFEIITAEVDEGPFPGEDAHKYVHRLARMKAQQVAKVADEESIIIAADTTVVNNGKILGKPFDSDDAVRMLRQLRGNRHQVFTAIAALRVKDRRLITDICKTEVPMRNYSDEEICAYVASGDPLDKAGAYAIQNAEFHPVDNLHGCYASVMGLPLCHLMRIFLEFEIKSKADVPANCQLALKYDCDAFEDVLRAGRKTI